MLVASSASSCCPAYPVIPIQGKEKPKQQLYLFTPETPQASDSWPVMTTPRGPFRYFYGRLFFSLARGSEQFFHRSSPVTCPSNTVFLQKILLSLRSRAFFAWYRLNLGRLACAALGRVEHRLVHFFPGFLPAGNFLTVRFSLFPLLLCLTLPPPTVLFFRH